MPELPEVENLRLGLEKSILDQKIKRVVVNKPKLVSGKGTKRPPSNSKKILFIKGITGEKIVKIDRRAKNLIFKLSRDKIILVHLKMSGQFVYQPKDKSKSIMGGHPIELSEKTLPNKHSHVIFELEKGNLYYNDTRMFGYLLYYNNTKTFEKGNHFETLGVEPLSSQFSTKYFINSLKDKNVKIKKLLLEQKIVAGLGNIYADEVLFEAHIRPNRNASTLTNTEIKKLHQAIIRIIKKAIKVGGSSVATYRLLDNTQGNYAREHKVYGKGGEKCSNCHKILSKIIITGRTTVFCSRCQK